MNKLSKILLGLGIFTSVVLYAEMSSIEHTKEQMDKNKMANHMNHNKMTDENMKKMQENHKMDKNKMANHMNHSDMEHKEMSHMNEMK